MRDMPSEKVIDTGYVSLWDKTVSANVNAARFLQRKTVGGYRVIENAFVKAFLPDDGETVSDAKLRLAEEHCAWVAKHLAIIGKPGYENYLLEMMDI